MIRQIQNLNNNQPFKIKKTRIKSLKQITIKRSIINYGAEQPKESQGSLNFTISLVFHIHVKILWEMSQKKNKKRVKFRMAEMLESSCSI